MRRIEPHKFLCQFIDLGKALSQFLFSYMTHIQVHYLAMRMINGPAFLLFMPDRLTHPVARPQLHELVTGLVTGRTKSVILKKPITILVDQIPSFTTTGLSKEKSGTGHAGRVILH